MNTFKKNQLDELIGGDMNSSGGDRNITNDSEIETGPVQKPFNDNSDYEKGEATTTDKVAARYRQDIPWFAIYSFGGNRTGLPTSNIYEKKENKTIIKKKTVEEKIEDLVKKSKSVDLTKKNYNSKLEKIADSINDTDLTDEELKELSKIISNKKPKENKNL
jgi:hypothetical protein